MYINILITSTHISHVRFPCLTLSLGQLFTEMYDTTKKWPSDKVKENCETSLKVHCIMQLSLSYEVFRWHSLNIML